MTDADRGVDASRSEQDLRRWIVDRLAERSGVTASDIDPTAPFSSLGVDSVAAVELVADLESRLGRELDPTLVFSAESPVQLAAVLASGASGARRRRRPSTPTGPADTERAQPIAVVGIGCRLPGAWGVEEYWQLLREGTDAVSEVPDRRWDRDPALPARVDLGGFVAGIDQFDPAFFGITQLEADRMDPQQRMLLEVAWEALEDAAVRPSTLRGTDVGVFVGISTNEYSRRQSASPELIDVFFGTGNALSIAANRVSYALDLHGPSIAVDTACSSSLVAVHLACASLRRGECSSALAGGANAILTPLLTLNFTGAGVIAPDGRCKTFDAAADGIVRGEGTGVVHLKRLSDAVADGDRIYCVIDGSATNQDGRSNGLTAPNPDAQMDVFAAACEDAGVDPASVDYVEAHGTGTVLGDAMELRSLDAVYGQDRTDEHPLLVGSVKTNIGHLESAAGIAGLIKTALSLHHAQIPPTLHYREPNPYLTETNHIEVVDELRPWGSDGVRRAGVSGFGFGGTNAHVLLSSAPDSPEAQPRSTAASSGDGPIVLPLSARSAGALVASAEQHAELLAARPDDARDLAIAQALTRDQHPRRLAVVASDGEAVAAALSEVAAGRRSGAAIAGDRRSSEPVRVAFLFSGQGRAWWPLDPELLDDPVIGATLRTCDTELREIADFSLLELIRSGEAVMDHGRAQPLLFALQVALAARWRAFGVEPDLIVGQSIGEIAAAHVSGALPLADALEIVLHRGRLMEESNGTGHTAFVELPAAEVEEMVAELDLEVAIAAVTAPDNCVVSGPKADTVAIVEAAAARGVMAQVFDVGDIPGHGPLMAPYADKLTTAVDFLDPRPTTVPMISSVTAGPVGGEELDAEYWGRNLRQQVRLLEAIEVAVDHGAELFIEIAPHPVVSFSTRRTLESIGSDAVVQHTVKQGEPGALALRRSLASAWTAGATVDWRAVTGRGQATARALPSPWDNRRCWFDLEPDGSRVAAAPIGSAWHPLLDDGAADGAGTTTWRATTSDNGPATLLELAVAAIGVATGRGPSNDDGSQIALTGVGFASGLVDGSPLGDRSDLTVSVRSRDDHHRWWIAAAGDHGARVVARGSASVLDDAAPLLLPLDRLAVDADAVEDDRELPDQVVAAKADDRTAVLQIEVPAVREGMPRWAVDPRVLDAVVAATLRLGPNGDDAAELRRIDRIVLRSTPGTSSRAVVDRDDGDVVLVDEWGAPVLELSGAVVGAGRPTTPPGELLVTRWSEQPGAGASGDDHSATSHRWIVVGRSDDDLLHSLATALDATALDATALDAPLGADGAAGLLLVDPDPGLLADLLAAPTIAGRTVQVVTSVRSVGTVATLPALLRRHPEVDLRSVELDDRPESLDALLQVLQRGDAAPCNAIREGSLLVGRLEPLPIPTTVVHSEPLGSRDLAAVWGDDGELRAVPAPGAPSTPSTDPVTVRVERALVAGATDELAMAGQVAGVAAIGEVIDGPAELVGATVAVVGDGTATRSVVVDADRAWPVGSVELATAALVRLLSAFDDLVEAADREPAVVSATFDALLSTASPWADAVVSPADWSGQRPARSTVVDLGDHQTPVEVTTARWSTDGTWGVLAADGERWRDAVGDMLVAAGAQVIDIDDAVDPAALTGVVAVGTALSSELAELDVPVVWIGPSDVLLGATIPDPATTAAAAAMWPRLERDSTDTAFLVGADVDPAVAAEALGRVLLAELPLAAYDPSQLAELASAGLAHDGWFGALAAAGVDELDLDDDSVAALLVAAPASQHLELLKVHLAAEIASIIGIEADEIDHDQPVDTYGVDSLVGMEMRSRIETSFRYEVPLSELTRTMTTSDLAGHLLAHALPALLSGGSVGAADGAATATGARAVVVQRGDGPVSWWVPGIFGSAEAFGPLGQELADHEMWAIEDADVPATSVGVLAGRVLTEIRSRQPVGPYRIGGYSYGALVAVEVAIVLEAAGEEVERLWLLDPPPPFAPDDAATRADRARRVAELLVGYLEALFGTSGLQVGELPPLEAGADLSTLVVRLADDASSWSPDRIAGRLDALWRTISASLEAMAGHRPSGVVAATTELVVAEHSGLFGLVPGADWSDFLADAAGPTTLDTDHAGLLLAPHTAALAAVIRRSLERSTTRQGAAHPEDPMTTTGPPATLTQRAKAAVLRGLTASSRSRSAVGAVGSIYGQADFFLRALAAERRFRRNAVMGDGFIAGDHAQIVNLTGDPERVRFGRNCLVDGFINVQEYGYFSMGSYSGIGVDVRIDCAGYVEIGNGCTMAEGVYIIDGLHHPILADERIKHGIDLFQGDHVMDAYGPGTETSFVRIEDLVWIGIRAIVLSGVTIGRGSVVAAGAVVSQDVPPFSVVAGNPATVVGRIPGDEVDIEGHPTYIEVHGTERLPDTRRPTREVLDEIAARVAARRR